MSAINYLDKINKLSFERDCILYCRMMLKKHNCCCSLVSLRCMMRTSTFYQTGYKLKIKVEMFFFFFFLCGGEDSCYLDTSILLLICL